MPRIRRVTDADHAHEKPGAGSAAPPVEQTHEPGAEQPSPQPTEILAPSEHYAEQLRECVASLFMFASMTKAFKNFDAGAFKLFRDRLLADCGSPADPIEIMMIEQLALAHFNAGLLHCRAANSSSFECAGVYSNAAAHLQAEQRRSALALQAYRIAARQLAHDPTKDLVIAGGEADPIDDQPGKKCIDDEKGVRTEDADADETIIPYPESSSFGPRLPGSTDEAPDHPRRAGTTPRRRAGAAAVGAGHRAANA